MDIESRLKELEARISKQEQLHSQLVDDKKAYSFSNFIPVLTVAVITGVMIGFSLHKYTK